MLAEVARVENEQEQERCLEGELLGIRPDKDRHS